jgi:hypothetical protein
VLLTFAPLLFLFYFVPFFNVILERVGGIAPLLYLGIDNALLFMLYSHF